MHMLLTSLSAIYQGRVPTLLYGQRHVDQMSRAHLRYVLTGEIVPWLDKLITYITDPLNNEDPEPYSKSYNEGGTELPEQELARKATKRQKTIHIVHEPSSIHHTRLHNPRRNHNTHTVQPHTSAPTKLRPRKLPPTNRGQGKPFHTLP